ncbi:hypothetical protein TRFO_21981 [Tritrichomonas foetus]|uniref:Uncharacterized protein n=1 Tax=Tritrichomonas foetus TaxID=1144522 RepID=A0A1J4KCT9_9EUKA|nr:hypothetical protein TRFO_21981 [Tritrichomonas foetus]|eukprot:OHT09233.1 hypothetical protein TRFO_21981 [Tritrichomonas foetus]
MSDHAQELANLDEDAQENEQKVEEPIQPPAEEPVPLTKKLESLISPETQETFVQAGKKLEEIAYNVSESKVSYAMSNWFSKFDYKLRKFMGVAEPWEIEKWEGPQTQPIRPRPQGLNDQNLNQDQNQNNKKNNDDGEELEGIDSDNDHVDASDCDSDSDIKRKQKE